MIKEKFEKLIKEIKEKGTITANEPIFNEFNNYARELDLDVVFSTFIESRVSICAVQTENEKSKSVSTISIFLGTTENLKKNKINPHNSNWNSEYRYTQTLIQKWNELLDKYCYPQDYKSDPMLIFIYSLESLAIVKLVYLCKDLIIEWMNKEKFNPKPEYILCSSNPSYNIIFKNKKDFDNSNSSVALLNEQIHKILNENDILNYYEKGKVAINIYHKEMEGINMYGLHRED